MYNFFLLTKFLLFNSIIIIQFLLIEEQNQNQKEKKEYFVKWMIVFYVNIQVFFSF